MRHLFVALGVAVLALVLINQCHAGDLPTEEEVWATVRSEGFGPVIGAEPPNVGVMTTESTFTASVRNGEYFWTSRYPQSVELAEDGRYMYVVYREPSNIYLTSYPGRQAPDYVYREIYGVEDGRIVYLGRQQAKVTPEKVIDEVIEFEPFCEDCE